MNSKQLKALNEMHRMRGLIWEFERLIMMGEVSKQNLLILDGVVEVASTVHSTLAK